MRNKDYLLIFLSFIIASCSHQLPDFTSRLSSRMPSNASTQAIGEYSLGCLQGGKTFTGKEKGLLISQMKRGRYWGHSDLIDLLTRAGTEFAKEKKTLIIGDLSQSRGGPTLTGHNSHQNGLDVDVWFKVLSEKDEFSFYARETEEMLPIERPEIDQIKMIHFFASDASVERIFINPSFKRMLCADSGSTRLSDNELHKLRAWWGHDDHIHVRLRCPSDSPSCVSQMPIPPGNGCGEDLNWWFTEGARDKGDFTWEETKSAYLKKVNNLPKECSFYSELY